MSKFTTSIAVNVQELMDALPKNSYVHGISFDKEKNEVVVLWEQEKFETGFTVPIDFPLPDLKKKKLPNRVKELRDKKKEDGIKQLESVAQSTEPLPEEPRVIRKPLTLEEWKAEFAKGTELEFQGIEIDWRPVTKDHVWTEGFHYRKKVS